MTEQRNQRQDQVNYEPPAGPALFKAALRGAILTAQGVIDAEILVRQARDDRERQIAETNHQNRLAEDREAQTLLAYAQQALAERAQTHTETQDAEQARLTEQQIAEARRIIDEEVPDELQPYYELGLINAQLGGLGISHENVMEQIGERGEQDRKTQEEERDAAKLKQEALETLIRDKFGDDPEIADLMILESQGVGSAGAIATGTVKERQEVARREAEAQEEKEQQKKIIKLLSKLKGRGAIDQDAFDTGLIAAYGDEPLAKLLVESTKNAAAVAEAVDLYREEIQAWAAKGLIPPQVQKDFLGPVQQRMLNDPAIKLIRTAKRAIDMIDMSSEIASGTIGPNAVNELLALYGLIRAADPGSVVREGEIAIFVTGRADIEALGERLSKITEPTILTETEHRAILSFAKGLRTAYAKDYQAIVGAYESILEGQGLLNLRDASGKLIHATSPRTILSLPGLETDATPSAQVTNDGGPDSKPPVEPTPANNVPRQMTLQDDETNRKAAEELTTELKKEGKSVTPETVREKLTAEGQTADAITMIINYLREKGYLDAE